MAFKLSLLILSFFIFFVFPSLSHTKIPRGFSAAIINSKSPRSPFYQSTLSRRERFQQAIQAKTHPADSEYVVEFLIGTPSTLTYAILDTGSTLSWLQCLPCIQCYHQTKALVFDPSTSFSYLELDCYAPDCEALGETIRDDAFCSPDGMCDFNMTYGDKAFTYGRVAQETLQFFNDFSNFTVDNIFFGCGHQMYEPWVGEGIPGIIGLSREPYSLVSQMHYSKFSYCFGDADDPNAYGRLSFGNDSWIYGNRTPIINIMDRSMYFVDILNISIDDVMLPIPNDTFSIKGETGGMIIDSGATYTLLNRTAFNLVCNELHRQMPEFGVEYGGNSDCCFETEETRTFPTITFHFTGIDLWLPFANAWERIELDGMEDVYCLAMKYTDDVSILGNHQQQNINVGYDIEKNEIAMDYLDCADTWK